jgi:signal transduction histidine kinase
MANSNYSEMLANLSDLIIKEKDPEQKATLRKLHKDLSKKLKKLIDKNIEDDSGEYALAIKGLEKANSSLKNSLKDIKNISETINALTEVVNIVGELV